MPLDFIDPAIFTFLTTFIFVFAIVFALLVYIRIFEKSRGAMAAIAVVAGLATAAFEPASIIVQQILPIASVGLVIVFFLVFIKKIFEKGEGRKPRENWPIAVSLIFLLILTGVFWSDISSSLGLGGLEATNLLWIVGIVFVIRYTI